LVACTASATLATNAGTFAGVQAAAAAAAAALAAATARARPYRGKLAWRTHASVALLALTAVSAAINIALMYATREGGGPGSASSWALGVLLVALALAIFALLLAAWWRALGGGGVWRGASSSARAARGRRASPTGCGSFSAWARPRQRRRQKSRQ
jgi:nitrate/nitrite transporter NarK